MCFCAPSVLAQALSPVISSTELSAILGRDTSIALLDIRPLNDYRKGHLPEAQQLWRPDIRDGEAPIKGLRASAQKLSAMLQSRGVDAGDRLVVYDGKGNPDAARLWWMLTNYGYNKVQLLDGGLMAWDSAGLRIDTGLVPVDTGSFVLGTTQPDWCFASLEDVQSAMADSSIVLLDTRTEAEYTGDFQKKGAARAGRIPRSRFFDWSFAIDYTGNKALLPLDEIRKRLALIGVDSTMRVITYCQSGVRSAHTTFVLTQLLGYRDVRNYDGSWIEWSQREELSVETGPVPVFVEVDTVDWWDLWYFWVPLVGGVLLVARKLRR